MMMYLYDGYRFKLDRFDCRQIDSDRLWDLYY